MLPSIGLWFKGEWGLKVFFERFFPDGKGIDDFCLWSFGENFATFKLGSEFMQAWNLVHGDQLLLKPGGSIAIDAENMFEVYKEFFDRAPTPHGSKLL